MCGVFFCAEAPDSNRRERRAMSRDDYDLVVIGAGSGGVRAARMAAGYGARVAIIEEYRVGGTCVIRGCVPKKLFVYASRFSDMFDIAGSFGWQVDASFDWPTLVANKDKEIARLEAAYVAGARKARRRDHPRPRRAHRPQQRPAGQGRAASSTAKTHPGRHRRRTRHARHSRAPNSASPPTRRSISRRCRIRS